MTVTCKFKFPRLNPIYCAGEELTGSIYLNTTKRFAVEAISVVLVGRVRVQWAEREIYQTLEPCDDMSIENRLVYTGKSEHLRDSVLLRESVVLEPNCGCIERFAFKLPENLPATYTQQCGELSYTLSVVLQRKSTFNKVFKQSIIIKSRLDLGARQELGEPRTIGNTTNLSVPRTGFVPGQQITFELSHLETIPECTKVQVNLCQCSTYHATKPQAHKKRVEHILNSCSIKVVCSNASGLLHIPLGVYISTTTEDCPLQVLYYLEAVCYAKRRILLKMAMPITIGTVPPDVATTPRKLSICNQQDGLYCYDNFASNVLSFGDADVQLINEKLAQSQQQQLQKYIAHVSQQNYVSYNGEIELTLFKTIQDCDRVTLIAMPEHV